MFSFCLNNSCAELHNIPRWHIITLSGQQRIVLREFLGWRTTHGCFCCVGSCQCWKCWQHGGHRCHDNRKDLCFWRHQVHGLTHDLDASRYRRIALPEVLCIKEASFTIRHLTHTTALSFGCWKANYVHTVDGHNLATTTWHDKYPTNTYNYYKYEYIPRTQFFPLVLIGISALFFFGGGRWYAFKSSPIPRSYWKPAASSKSSISYLRLHLRYPFLP